MKFGLVASAANVKGYLLMPLIAWLAISSCLLLVGATSQSEKARINQRKAHDAREECIRQMRKPRSEKRDAKILKLKKMIENYEKESN